jgi:actin-like ATPase involved in cell morphogenesis
MSPEETRTIYGALHVAEGAAEDVKTVLAAIREVLTEKGKVPPSLVAALLESGGCIAQEAACLRAIATALEDS